MTAASPDAAPRETDPPDEAPAPRWGVTDVIVAFLFAQVASLIGFTVYAAVKGVSAADLSSNTLTIGELALLQIPLWMGLLGVPLVSTRFRGNGPVIDLGWWMKWRDVPLGIAIGVVCQFVLVPLVTLPVFWLTNADGSALEAPARELTDKASSGVGWVILVLVVVVAAPVAEEVFFRGMLQRTLARSWPIWPAMIATSLFFAASHFELLQFPALAAFGLVLSYCAHRTGRLGLDTWAHVGFNATTVLILFVQR